MFRTGVCLKESSKFQLGKVNISNAFQQNLRKIRTYGRKTLTFEYMFDIINKNTCSTGG